MPISLSGMCFHDYLSDKWSILLCIDFGNIWRMSILPLRQGWPSHRHGRLCPPQYEHASSTTTALPPDSTCRSKSIDAWSVLSVNIRNMEHEIFYMHNDTWIYIWMQLIFLTVPRSFWANTASVVSIHASISFRAAIQVRLSHNKETNRNAIVGGT